MSFPKGWKPHLFSLSDSFKYRRSLQCKWARVRKTCTRAYTREVRSPSLAKCGGWGKEIRKFWSAFENIQTIVKYDFLNIFKHLKVFVLNLENFKLVCFLQIWKKMETIRKKKKCYIALWIICVLWTFNLLDSISISNNPTRLLSNNKKKKCSKTKRVVLEPFVPTGKEQLRNYFNHTMFA